MKCDANVADKPQKVCYTPIKMSHLNGSKYKGIVADGQLTVPLLGTAEWSETITYSMFGTETSSVTFFVRIGPNKISVRASEVVECNNYDTMFAFEYFD